MGQFMGQKRPEDQLVRQGRVWVAGGQAPAQIVRFDDSDQVGRAIEGRKATADRMFQRVDSDDFK